MTANPLSRKGTRYKLIGLGIVDKSQGADQDAADQADRVGLEHVRRHARAIADVVADVVRDRRGIAGIIFVKVLLDLLADGVRADVRRLGIDTVAQTGEDRDE